MNIKDYKEKDINIIIKDCLEKDSDSICILLIRLRPVIISSIRKYCNHIEDFDDLIQDGYLHIIESLDRYDLYKGVHFLGYIKYSLKFFYLDKAKKIKYHVSLNEPAFSEESNAELLDFIEDLNVCIEKDYEYKESVRLLYKAIGSLSNRERQVIVMYYIGGYRLKTIARKLGLVYRTVVNTKVNGVMKLRKGVRDGTFCL